MSEIRFSNGRCYRVTDELAKNSDATEAKMSETLSAVVDAIAGLASEHGNREVAAAILCAMAWMEHSSNPETTLVIKAIAAQMLETRGVPSPWPLADEFRDYCAQLEPRMTELTPAKA